MLCTTTAATVNRAKSQLRKCERNFLFCHFYIPAKSPNDRKMLLVWCLFMDALGFFLIEQRIGNSDAYDAPNEYQTFMPTTEDVVKLLEPSESVRATAQTLTFPSIFPAYHNTLLLRCIWQRQRRANKVGGRRQKKCKYNSSWVPNIEARLCEWCCLSYVDDVRVKELRVNQMTIWST